MSNSETQTSLIDHNTTELPIGLSVDSKNISIQPTAAELTRPEVILGRTSAQTSSAVLPMSSNPRQEDWTDSSHSQSVSRHEDDISTLGYDENYCCDHVDGGRQIGLSYGMLDDTGAPYEPVKLKTISLCCY